MGDVRFVQAYERLRDAHDRAAELRDLSDEAVIGALAAASREMDPLLANVLATEAMNRARRAKAIAASIGEGVLVLDANARVQYANPMAERMLERARRDLVGQDVQDALRPVHERGDRVDLRRDVARVVAQREPVCEREDLLFSRGGGSAFPVSVSLALDVDKEGDVNALVLAFRDITERRCAQRELEETHARYRLLAENVTDVVTTTTPEGVITWVSPSCRSVLQYLPDEIVGHPWSHLVVEADLAARPAQRRRPGEAWSATFRVRRKDGSLVWIESNARAVPDATGTHIDHIVAVSRDVTRRHEVEDAMRASEARHRTTLEQVADLIVLNTLEGEFTYVSPVSRRLLGYAPDEMVGRRAQEFLHPDDAPQVREARRRLVRAAEGVTWTARLRCRDGRWLRIECNERAIRGPDGRIREVVSVCRDVTRRAA